MKHANISIFVPHLGCPNDCSFCNQRHITGESKSPNCSDIDKAVAVALASGNIDPQNTEIAFFGGSFTAIEKEYMLTLLESAYKYVLNGTVRGIRVSTRPDCISDEIIKTLKRYGVCAIELGAQSLNDNVLTLNRRGHTAKDVCTASALIKNAGLELGLQMMTGLYGDTDDGAMDTARQIIDIHPNTVRIYPTIVLENTCLAEYYKSGIYKPQNLDDAVSLCAELVRMFNSAGIKVIRNGLHSIDNNAYVAGPWHPAFSELCDSRIFYNKIISSCEKNKKYEVIVNPADISKAIGQKRENLIKLQNAGYKIRFTQNSKTDRSTIRCKEVN